MKKYLLSGVAVLALLITGCPSEVRLPPGGVKDITSEVGSDPNKPGDSTPTPPQENVTVID